MLLISMAILGACTQDATVAPTDSNSVSETGWDNYGDADSDSDNDSDTDGHTGDTDTDPPLQEQSACQLALASTNPAYPVFPSWDGRESDNLTVTFTGATRPWATVSWGSPNSGEGWFIACAEIVGQTTTSIRVEPVGTYGASSFSNADPGDGAPVDQNGFYWYSYSVTGGDLGGQEYEVTSNDGWNAVLTEVVQAK